MIFYCVFLKSTEILLAYEMIHKQYYTIMIWYREIHEKGSGDFVLCRGIDSVYSVQTAETTSPLFVNSSAGQWDDTQSHRLILLWYSNQYYISYTFKLQSNLPKQYKISIHSLKCTIHLYF